MAALKLTGATLLLEHLFLDQQPALDRYIGGDNSQAIAPEVGVYLNKFDHADATMGNHNLVGILMAAHKHGVPVRGVEDPFALDAGAFGAISVAWHDAWGMGHRLQYA